MDEGAGEVKAPQGRRAIAAEKAARTRRRGSQRGPKLRAAVKAVTHRRIRGYAILRGVTVGALIDEWTAMHTEGMRFSHPGLDAGEGD